MATEFDQPTTMIGALWAALSDTWAVLRGKKLPDNIVGGYWFDKPRNSPYRWRAFRFRRWLAGLSPRCYDLAWGDWSLAWLIRDTARKLGVWHGC